MNAEKRSEMRLDAINRAVDMLAASAHNEGLTDDEMRTEAERIADNSACMACYDIGCPACLGDDEC